MVKRKIIWSHRAKLDLLKILDYFNKRNGSNTFSNKLNARFRKSIRLLINQPNLGLMTDIANVRILLEGDYAVFYQADDDNV